MAVKISTLSKRGAELAANPSIYDRFKSIIDDLYDHEKNPSGFISLGVAENYPMLSEISEYMNSSVTFTTRDSGYGEGPWGSIRLRKGMAKFMTRNFSAYKPVDPENLVFAAGVTSICEMLGFAIGDPGDGILFSRPIYQAFQMDFGLKAKVKCIFTNFEEVDQFSPEAAAKYEQALLKAQTDGIRIRALMLCNPHNPLVSVYPVEDPLALPFCSALSFDSSNFIDAKFLHIIYGMSKDFSANGLRLYSQNYELLRSLRSIAQFHWASNPSQTIFASMLENEDWLYKFLSTTRETLREKNEVARKILDDAGIKYIQGANAGFFLILDLRSFISPRLADDYDWNGEEALLKAFFANKVMLTPGKDMAAEEPGYFRLIFAQEDQVLRTGLERITQTLRSHSDA